MISFRVKACLLVFSQTMLNPINLTLMMVALKCTWKPHAWPSLMGGYTLTVWSQLILAMVDLWDLKASLRKSCLCGLMLKVSLLMILLLALFCLISGLPINNFPFPYLKILLFASVKEFWQKFLEGRRWDFKFRDDLFHCFIFKRDFVFRFFFFFSFPKQDEENEFVL